MKYATIAAAALLPLAWAADDLDSRSSKTYEISNLTAACYDAYETHYCVWDIVVSASTNPEFGEGVETMCESPSGALIGCDPGESGSYSLATGVHEHNDTLLVTLRSRSDMARMAMPLEDLVAVADPPETTDGGKSALWSFKGGEAFVVPAQDLDVTPDDPPFIAPTAVEWDLASASASGIATAANGAPTKKPSSTSIASVTAAPTADAEPSATDAAASASATPNGATREGAFAGVLFSVGLMALVF